MKKPLYGAAYYEEYLPYDRLDEDIKMMKKAGIDTVRIAESTWSTHEPQDGIFDFTHINRVIDAMEANKMNVIVGTPTYAVPTWMVKAHPDILATTKKGPGIYGARQIMDITHPVYLFYAERIIRKIMEQVSFRPCVIGYQLDNETKYYDTASPNVQLQFIKYLRKKFNNDLDALNYAFGLDYWSNRINSWEDFPDVRGTINGSLGGEFEKFQRTLVDDFLSWQASIVNEYRREDQFTTQNFDFEWRNYSYGVQPSVNHFHASKCLTIAGCDIYHPTQDDLTGREIAFGGDLTRSLKNDNYLVLETQAQGHLSWLPYKGQLRLQAYSHLASGANSVMYWHWHSIHNSFETYWKGLLSHDFAENDTYKEAAVIGNEWKTHGEHLVNLKKNNKIALLISNEALTALQWFRIDSGMMFGSGIGYNDIVRYIYDTLYCLNAECDFITPEMTGSFSKYQMILAPALYAVPEDCLKAINQFVENGGHFIATFKSAVADENIKVYHHTQPHIIHKCLGISYNEFTKPEEVYLKSDYYKTEKADSQAGTFMELVKPDTAKVLASYDHYNWKGYAAVTQNQYGKGAATYIGCLTTQSYLKEILTDCLKKAGLLNPQQTAAFPVIIRKGINDFGRELIYYLNYSKDQQTITYHGPSGKSLLDDREIHSESTFTIKPWNLVIIERSIS